MTCPAFAPDNGFVAGVLDNVDCQAQAIGSGGYQALAAPGSTLSLVLTGLLTLFVALFGYRLLLGRTPAVRDGVMALVKIGVVVALATSWTAYRTLVYDVAFRAPAELAGDVGRPAGLPGAAGGLVWRLDNTDRLFVALEAAGIGTPAGAATAPAPYLTPGPATGVPSPAPVAQNPAARPAGPFDGWALSGARLLYLAGAVGALAALRLIAAVLLALGPFFFAFLLFDGTRGLFEGWLRVLAGTALGALGTALALGVELALLEPRLAYLLALRAAGYAIPGAAVELMVIALVFALVLVAMLGAAARVAYGFRFPAAWRFRSAPQPVASSRDEARFAVTRELVPVGGGERSRAAAVADAVAAGQRREAGPAAPAAMSSGASRAAAARPAAGRDDPAPPPVPLGRSFRRTRTRASASARRRDRAA